MGNASKSFSVYMVTVGVVGIGVLVWLGAERWGRGVAVSLVWEAGFFLALAVLVGLQPVRLPRGAVTTVGFAVDYSCLLIFGGGVAALIGVISETVLLWRSAPLRKLFNVGQVVLSFAGAGKVYEVLGGSFGRVELNSWQSGVALLGCGVAYFTISSLLIAVAMGLWEGRRIGGMWVVSFRWAAPRYLALAPFGLLMAIVYQTEGLGMVAVGLFLVPLVGARYAFQGAMEMLEVHRETVHALSNALEAYDPYTRNHSELVTRYALAVGEQMGLAEARLETLEWACRLHDIGKCRQDWDSIIRKPGRPSEREWEVIRQHPVEGSRLAERMEFLPHTAGEVARIVRAHHERIDGSGYPDGRGGEHLSLETRILGVADAFEAMTAKRAYKRRMGAEEAIAELRRCAGKQFDGEVVEALAELWDGGQLELEVSVEQVAELAVAAAPVHGGGG
jgi:putative nucleotidyltransferase with HDIG domain